jgi:hypothetical protein
MKFSTEPSLYLFLVIVIWAFLIIFFELSGVILPNGGPCEELYMISFDCEPSNLMTMSIELWLGLIAAIIVTAIFRKKEQDEKNKRRREGLKQICDRFVHAMEHVTAVNNIVRRYYAQNSPSNTLQDNTLNLNITKNQCDRSIRGLLDGVKALENSLLLVSGDLEHNVMSGIRFFIDTVRTNTKLFENKFSDEIALSGLVGNANATKDRLNRIAPDLIKNAELELKELTTKVRQGNYDSKDVIDFVWKK